MTSRDFGYLTLRNTVAYRKDDTFVPDNYVFTVSSFGKGKWTNSLMLNDLNVSTLEAKAIETSSIQISSLIDSDGTTGNAGDVLHTDGSTAYWAPVGAGTGFWTADGDNIYNNNIGNVGIGITTPQFPLDVNGVARFGNQTGNTSSFEINLGTTGVGGYRSAFIYSDGTNMRINNQQDGNLYLYTNNYPKLSILSTGNVGIGTSTPTYLLEVAGNTFTSTISTLKIYDVLGQSGTNNQVLTAGPSGNSVIWSTLSGSLPNGTCVSDYLSWNGSQWIPGLSTTSSVNLGCDAGATGQGANSIAIGNGAGSTSQSTLAIAIGNEAGETSQDVFTIAIGSLAGNSSQSRGAIAIGPSAGFSSQNIFSIAIGSSAGENTQGPSSIAIGLVAGSADQGANSIAIGTLAGNSHQGSNSIAIGKLAGETYQSSNTIVLNATGSAVNTFSTNSLYIAPIRQDITNSTLFYNPTTFEITYSTLTGGSLPTGTCVSDYLSWNGSQWSTSGSDVHIGCDSGIAQGASSIAIGNFAGNSNQADHSIAIGIGAGALGQSTNAIAIGESAGLTSQGLSTIAIGFGAGSFNQSTNAVSFGTLAGNYSQGESSIAIGTLAAYNSQQAESIAIGTKAAMSTQGIYSIAIGNFAGYQLQKEKAIAIGYNAAGENQSSFAIAIGTNAGVQNQGENAIAIGHQAGGASGFQGENSIAIGYAAGSLNQSSNTIVLNASGSFVNTLSTNALYIAPIRQNDTTSTLYYDPTTFEVSYGTVPSSSQKAYLSVYATSGQLISTGAQLLTYQSTSFTPYNIDYDSLTQSTFKFNNSGNYQLSLTLNYTNMVSTQNTIFGVWLKKNDIALSTTTWYQDIKPLQQDIYTTTFNWTTALQSNDTIGIWMSSLPNISTIAYQGIAGLPTGPSALVTITQLG